METIKTIEQRRMNNGKWRSISLFTFIFSLFISLSSCGNDNEMDIDNNDPVAVKFTSGITAQPKTRAADATWAGGDAIGIYMFETGGNYIISEGAENKKYTTTSGTLGTFTATGTDIIYYPVNGDKVDFLAYYPQSAAVNSFVYSVNVKEQGIQKDIDLMLADKVANKDKANTAVALTFKHQLSKLVLNVKTSASVPSLTDMTVKIKGMNTKADFTLTTGVLGTAATPAAITPAGSGAAFEAILLPTALAAAQTVEFTVGGNTYIWTMSDNIKNPSTLVAGTKYTYDITLEKTGVGVTGSITNWVGISGTGTAN